MEGWIYKGEAIDAPPEGFICFVYIITNKKSNRKYIGKKNFFKSRYLPKTKTRKRRKKVISETDWREYYGSCKELLQEIDLLGKESYNREILHLCEAKGKASYIEAKEQFDREVLLRDDYYNGIIQCRINKKHLGSMEIE